MIFLMNPEKSGYNGLFNGETPARPIAANSILKEGKLMLDCGLEVFRHV